MADEAHQTHPPEAPQPPLTTAEETESPPSQQPEPISEPPLASLSLDQQKESIPPTENPKESAIVAEKDAPLPPPPPEPATSAAPPPQSLGSFKEERNKLADLSPPELKSLQEFKILVQEELISNQSEEISIWGIPLLKDDRSDVVLLKFLRARDFKVKESFAMLKNTLKWRRDFGVDELLKEDLGDDLEKIVFMHGHDKEGHPVSYNVYGEFQNRELYAKTFGDEEKRETFLRWRIQFLERSIRKLDFSPCGINTIFQVSDLKNSPGPGKRELRIATRQALLILQDNYPEFVAKQTKILRRQDRVGRAESESRQTTFSATRQITQHLLEPQTAYRGSSSSTRAQRGSEVSELTRTISGDPWDGTRTTSRSSLWSTQAQRGSEVGGLTRAISGGPWHGTRTTSRSSAWSTQAQRGSEVGGLTRAISGDPWHETTTSSDSSSRRRQAQQDSLIERLASTRPNGSLHTTRIGSGSPAWSTQAQRGSKVGELTRAVSGYPWHATTAACDSSSRRTQAQQESLIERLASTRPNGSLHTTRTISGDPSFKRHATRTASRGSSWSKQAQRGSEVPKLGRSSLLIHH